MSHYLDYNSGAPARPEAIAAATEALGLGGNPSSVHKMGRRARAMMENVREDLAEKLAVDAAGVIFTSCGGEANATALRGLGANRIIASSIEHPSVLHYADETIAATPDGLIDLAGLEQRLVPGDLVAAMLVNNETGVIQPVAEIAAIAHRRGALLHCDAVQAFGRIDFDLGVLGCDSMSISGHKLGGPSGVGALILADPDQPLKPLISGGGQERSRRAGTENAPAIAGLGAVLHLAGAAEDARLRTLRDHLENEIKALGDDRITIMGKGASRVGATSLIAVSGMSGERMVMALDLDGVMVSAGAACSSGKTAKSSVLSAMGFDDLAACAIRVSLGWASEEDDIERFLECFGRLVAAQKAA